MSELTQQTPNKHKVHFEITYTKNLGNFESAKVTVGLEQEGTGHPDNTMSKVKKWVENNLEAEGKKVFAQLGN